MTIAVLLSIVEFILISLTLWSSYNSILIINGKLGYHGTRKEDIPLIVDLLNPRTGDNIASLGCGDGRILTALPKINGVSYTGIDINRILIFFNQLKSKLFSQNIDFRVSDISKEPLYKYNKIYIFSTEEYLQQFKKQIDQQVSQNTTIVSYMYPIDNSSLQLVESVKGIHNIYKYKKIST